MGSFSASEKWNKAKVIEDPLIKELAEKYKKSAGQILLNWGLKRNHVVLNRSSKIDRIKENYESYDFDLSEEDVKKITDLNRDGRIFEPKNFEDKSLIFPCFK